MEIPREQAEKLKRYFINADPFLRGVLEIRTRKDGFKNSRGLVSSKVTLKAAIRHTARSTRIY